MTVDCDDAGIKYELSDYFTFKVLAQSSCHLLELDSGMVRYACSICGQVNSISG